MLQRWMIRFGLQNSVSDVFLNCTKNTELTAPGFARTVFFALTKIMSQPPAATGGEELFNNQHDSSCTRVSAP